MDVSAIKMKYYYYYYKYVDAFTPSDDCVTSPKARLVLMAGRSKFSLRSLSSFIYWTLGLFPVLVALEGGSDQISRRCDLGEQSLYIPKLVSVFEICSAIFQNDYRMQQIHGRIRRFCSSFKDGYSASFGALPHEE